MDGTKPDNLSSLEQILRTIGGSVSLPIALTILPITGLFALFIFVSLYLLHTALVKWDPLYFFIQVVLRSFTPARRKSHTFSDSNTATYA